MKKSIAIITILGPFMAYLLLSFALTVSTIALSAPLKSFQGLIEQRSLPREIVIEIRKEFKKEVMLYQEFQIEMARRYPREIHRPVVKLNLITEGARETVGILGGMGPLSDSKILVEVVSRLEEEKIKKNISLLSLPPPRGLVDYLRYGLSYFIHFNDFMKNNFSQVFLASNSAHTNLWLLKLMGEAQLYFNLPQYIVNSIGKSTVEQPILILGTTALWESKLYENLMKDKNIPYLSLKENDQISIQLLINNIKAQGPQPAETKNYLQRISKKYGTNRLLLACTELPLGLGAEQPSPDIVLIDSEQYLIIAILHTITQE